MKLWIIILILVLLVGFDKFLTYKNVKAVEKNFPEINPLKIEKNPVARWFFEKLGIGPGSWVYGLVSLITIFLVFFILRYFFGESIALYAVIIIYGLVISNNFYFLLKYSKIIK